MAMACSSSNVQLAAGGGRIRRVRGWQWSRLTGGKAAVNQSRSPTLPLAPRSPGREKQSSQNNAVILGPVEVCAQQEGINIAAAAAAGRKGGALKKYA